MHARCWLHWQAAGTRVRCHSKWKQRQHAEGGCVPLRGFRFEGTCAGWAHSLTGTPSAGGRPPSAVGLSRTREPTCLGCKGATNQPVGCKFVSAIMCHAGRLNDGAAFMTLSSIPVDSQIQGQDCKLTSFRQQFTTICAAVSGAAPGRSAAPRRRSPRSTSVHRRRLSPVPCRRRGTPALQRGAAEVKHLVHSPL